jgi:hypothetical protein
MSYDIVVMEDCASNYGVFQVPGSKAGTMYLVSLLGSEGGASCGCAAFRFSKRPVYDRSCKHIARLWEGGACLYNPQWKDGTAKPEFRPVRYTYEAFTGGHCPACGGPAVAVRRAV